MGGCQRSRYFQDFHVEIAVLASLQTGINDSKNVLKRHFLTGTQKPHRAWTALHHLSGRAAEQRTGPGFSDFAANDDKVVPALDDFAHNRH